MGKARPQPVRVRMYRHGLGDCFLLRFPGPAKKTVNVLIDCGIVLGARPIPDQDPPVDRLRAAVKDLLAECGNHIHLLIVTHEHWDHVSGFAQARDLFGSHDVKIDQLWVAWTEDPDDKQAEEIREERRQRMNALRAALAMRTPTPGAAPSPLESLQGFFGNLGAKDSEQTAEAFNWIKDRVKDKQYLRPGGKREVPGAKGVQAYVLGPPLDPKLMRKSKPSQSRDEIYLTPDVNRLAEELLAAGNSLDDTTTLRGPFDDTFGLSPEAAAVHPFFRERYGFTPEAGEPWRRIDNDWLALADRLALQLDSNTNNTSLVLAFELPSGDVLLFPGDAQIGNWLSWHTVKWEGEDTKAADLLRRVVLYKVSHHGSENATLSDQGMDMMPDGLAALLPVNEVQAHAKRWNDMPYDRLLAALERKKGKLMRLDSASQATAPHGAIVTDLYVEYEVGMEG